MIDPIRLDGCGLTPEQVAAVAVGAPLVLDDEMRRRMVINAAWYAANGPEGILRDKVGWLTGAECASRSEVRAFVLSHCAGVGEPLSPVEVRAMIAVRCGVLATGLTGSRPEVVDALLALLRDDVVPVVPSRGSTGAAGDAQLAHIARVVCGFGGEAWVAGERRAVASLGREPLRPTGKEALSLINGSSTSTALAALATARATSLLGTAEAACALSFEVVRADLACLDACSLEARHHPGAVAVAARLRAMLQGSTLCAVGRKPDPFSIRCAPAVLGAAHDAVEQVREVVTRELAAASDNPLVFDEGVGVVEAGNFHAAPIGLAMDHLKLALAQVASIAERRIFRMTYGQLSGLPSFLVHGSGLNSGLMLAQYTAASLASEVKGLSHPASVDTIPTAQHREDHVSMAPIAARGALRIADAVADILAIELLCGAQGLDLHLEGDGAAATQPVAAPGTRQVHATVRSRVPRWVDDRVLHHDLVSLGSAVREGCFSFTW